MRKILQNRILELGRGEEGVALVVTLAVFMFMYIFCAGVFAVGKMVKDRICLQNAADAAAYSAAVVQADTLSRIATINRAMSWTYAQMNKRRMDFVEWHWLDLARRDYQPEVIAAKNWVLRSQGKWHTGSRHTHGTMRVSPMVVNGRANVATHVIANGPRPSLEFVRSDNAVPNVSMTPVRRRLDNELSGQESYFNGQIGLSVYDNGSRYGIEGLQWQIDADMRAILQMNDSEKKLIAALPTRIDAVARGILRANVPDFDYCGYVVKQCQTPAHGSSGFMSPLESNAENELRFLEWGNTTKNASGIKELNFSASDFEAGLYDSIVNGYFRTGSEQSRWFPRVGDGGDGFLRQYRHPQDGPVLNVTWDWSASFCPKCRFWHDRLGNRHEAEGVQIKSGVRPGCCTIEDARLTGRYGRYYAGRATSGILSRAYPLVLKSNFFSGDGTITVGVARPNDNPWRSVLGKALSNIGLYHAFDPYLDWMVCFASARAGYKLLHGPSEYEDSIQEYESDGRWPGGRIRINQQVRVEMGDRDYCIDWKELKGVIRKLVKVRNRKGEIINGRDWHWQPEWVTPLWRQSWNLRQSDWDAVMIPVCRAASGAEERTDHARTYGDFREPCWGATDGNYLENLVKNETWIFPEDRASNVGAWYAFSAGPDKPLSISDYGYIDYEPGDLGGLLNKLPENYQGWQSNRGLRGGASVIKWPYRWRVSTPGSRLNWVELQKEMLH